MVSKLFDEIVSYVDTIFRRAQGLGASEVEIHVVETRRIRVDATKGVISRVTQGTRVDVGVRTVVGKKKGNAGGVVSSRDDVLKLVEDAVKIARVSKEDPSWPGFPADLGSGGEVEVFSKELAELEPKDAVDIVITSIKGIERYEGVRHTESLLVIASSETFLSNTNSNRDLRKSETSMVLHTGASSGPEGSYYDYHMARKLDLDKIAELSDNVGKRAKEAAEARAVETGIYTIILEPKVVAGVLSATLEPAFSAENVQQGRSPLKGKLGEKILSERITIKDEPFVSWSIGSTPFDDEGVPTRSKDIVSKGVLSTYLYDTYTASKEGKKSTGNGFKRSPWSDPSPSPTNIVIDVESHGLDSVVSEVKRGLIVGLTIGEWLSNPVSGMLNATVTFGYLIEQGSITRPVKGVIISGNIYEALGEKLREGAGEKVCIGSYCTPALVIENLRLAGK